VAALLTVGGRPETPGAPYYFLLRFSAQSWPVPDRPEPGDLRESLDVLTG